MNWTFPGKFCVITMHHTTKSCFLFKKHKKVALLIERGLNSGLEMKLVSGTVHQQEYKRKQHGGMREKKKSFPVASRLCRQMDKYQCLFQFRRESSSKKYICPYFFSNGSKTSLWCHGPMPMRVLQTGCQENSNSLCVCGAINIAGFIFVQHYCGFLGQLCHLEICFLSTLRQMSWMITNIPCFLYRL